MAGFMQEETAGVLDGLPDAQVKASSTLPQSKQLWALGVWEEVWSTTSAEQTLE